MRHADLIGLAGAVLLVCGLAFFVPSVRGTEMFSNWLLGPLLRLVGSVLILGWAMYRILNPRQPLADSEACEPHSPKSDSSGPKRAA